MTASFTTEHLKSTLAFPFKDEKWVTKFLVFFAISLASFLVPVIPSIIVFGYLYRIMRPIVKDGDLPKLPEWTDFGGLFKDGFRLFAVNFIYTLPALLIGTFGFIVYMSFFLLMPIMESGSSSEGLLVFLMFVIMGIFFLSLLFCMVWMLIVLILMPPALGHVVETDSFAAAFKFSSWWKVFRANIGGYFIAAVVFLGLYTLLMCAVYLFYLSIVLICLMYVAALIGGVYMAVVSFALWGQVYREGREILEAS